MSSLSDPVTLHNSHHAVIFAAGAITFKSIGQFMTDEQFMGLVANYIAIVSGVVSISWMIWHWIDTVRIKRKIRKAEAAKEKGPE